MERAAAPIFCQNVKILWFTICFQTIYRTISNWLDTPTSTIFGHFSQLKHEVFLYRNYEAASEHNHSIIRNTTPNLICSPYPQKGNVFC